MALATQRSVHRCIAYTTAALAAFAASPVFAATYCGASLTNASGLSKDDMTFNALAAADCYGVGAGNDSAAAINGLTEWQDSAGQWTLLASSQVEVNGGIGYGSLSGLDFTLAATSGTSGSWTLTAVDSNGAAYANLPAVMDFVGVLKAGTGFAAYFFDDVTVGADDNEGTWEIAFTNRRGIVPDLGHLNLYTRIDASGGIPPIPEAQTYAMMLAGLGLVAFVARRRRRI